MEAHIHVRGSSDPFGVSIYYRHVRDVVPTSRIKLSRWMPGWQNKGSNTRLLLDQLDRWAVMMANAGPYYSIIGPTCSSSGRFPSRPISLDVRLVILV